MLWWAVETTIVAGLAAGVVAFLCRARHVRPAVQHALWLVVLVKLLTPPLVSWPWAVERWGAQRRNDPQASAAVEHEDRAEDGQLTAHHRSDSRPPAASPDKGSPGSIAPPDCLADRLPRPREKSGTEQGRARVPFFRWEGAGPEANRLTDGRDAVATVEAAAGPSQNLPGPVCAEAQTPLEPPPVAAEDTPVACQRPVVAETRPAEASARLHGEPVGVEPPVAGPDEAASLRGKVRMGQAPPATAASPGHGRSLQRLAAVGAYLWLVGGLVMLAIQVRRLARVRRFLREPKPVPRWLEGTVCELAERLGVRPPDVAVVGSLGTPLLCSFGSPKLLWPDRLAEDLSPEACRAVVVHELAHLRRRDHWVGWLELAAACLWWWNPLFWLVRRRLRETADLACDAWVVEVLPAARRSYAEAVLTVCQSVSRTVAPMPALGVGRGARRAFERRLKMIVRERVPHRATWSSLVVVGLLGLFALPTWSQEKADRSATAEQPSPDLPAADTPAVDEPATEAPVPESGPAQPSPAPPTEADLPIVEPSPPSIPDDRPVPAAGSFVVRQLFLKENTATQDGGPPAPSGPAEPGSALGPAPSATQPAALDTNPLRVATAVRPQSQEDRIRRLEEQLATLIREVRALQKSASTPEPEPRYPFPPPSPAYRPSSSAYSAEQPLASAGHATRVTLYVVNYRLPKERAESLAAFLKEHVDEKLVAQVKVEGDSITVWSVPEASETVSRLVALMLSKTATTRDAELPLVGPRESVLIQEKPKYRPTEPAYPGTPKHDRRSSTPPTPGTLVAPPSSTRR